MIKLLLHTAASMMVVCIDINTAFFYVRISFFVDTAAS